MSIRQLNERKAFEAMKYVLAQFYYKTRAGDVGGLLGEAEYFPDGSTADPATWIDAGHQKIDEFLGTSCASSYTPEAKACRAQHVVVGALPPPMGAGGLNTRSLAQAGKVVDRAEFTKAGRALMKHGNRKVFFQNLLVIRHR